MGILCQIDPNGRTSKPKTLQEYGKLRDVLIQRPWESLSEEAFLDRVTKQGCAFYGCLFKGHDLMELTYQKLCWHTQTLIGVDFDKCPVELSSMVSLYESEGYSPWAGYRTFSDGSVEGLSSYRLLWKVDINLAPDYETVRAYIKQFAALAGPGLADKHSMDCSRMWQGSNSGVAYYNPTSAPLSLTTPV